MNDTEIWLERLNSLYKSQMRHAACDEGIQLVHIEILQYLSICNRYSNTAQALSEYLGQTKGSISQSLRVMESMGHIQRKPCMNDKRVVRLFITEGGRDCLQRVSHGMSLDFDDAPSVVELVKSLLARWQAQSSQKGFGQCQSCRYNVDLGNSEFECGLTKELLSNTDVKKICREHDFSVGSKLL